MSTKRIRSWAKWLVTALVLGGLLWYCNLEALVAALRQADVPQLLGFALLTTAATACGGGSLLTLFETPASAGWRSRWRFVVDYFYVQAMAQLTPAQLAEVALPYIAARGRYAGAAIAASLLIQRIISLLIVASIAVWGSGRWASEGLLWALLVGIGGAAGGLVLLMSRQAGSMPLLSRHIPALVPQLQAFRQAWQRIWFSHPLRLASHLAIMLVRFALSIAGNWMLFAAFEIQIPYADLAAITALAILATLLPVTIGGLGLTEGVFVLALSSYGYSPSSIVAASLSGRAAAAVMFCGWALLYFLLPTKGLAPSACAANGSPTDSPAK